MDSLTPQEWERYARQLRLKEWGPKGQKKLKRARVLVVGAGGLGSVVAPYLAAAGVGTLGLIDFDEVTLSNLHRQLLYREADLGKPKVWVAKGQLEKLNPHVRVVGHEGPLDADNAMALIGQYDLVADGSDNPTTRYLINDACHFLKKPLVSASAAQFDGQLITLLPEQGPCYRCVFPDGGQAGSCAAEGVLGPVVGVMGALQAMEVLKGVTGIGKSPVGRLITYDGLSARFAEWAVQRDPQCPLCGQTPTITELKGSPEAETDWELTARELQERKGDFTELDVQTYPLASVSEWLPGLDPALSYVVVCDSGQVSGQIARILRGSGFKAWNLLGGRPTPF